MHLKKFFPILIPLFILSSCTHYYYAPNMHNVPMLTEKKETKLTASYSNGGEVKSSEFQGAYAVNKKIGLMLNTAFGKSDPKSTNTNKGHGFFIEPGVGYFRPLNFHLVFESYLIAGYGSISNTYSNGLTLQTSFTRFGVQPMIGYNGKYFQVGISTRIAALNISKPNGYATLDSTNMARLQSVYDHPSSFLIEPALTIRGGLDWLKIQFQFGISNNLTNPSFTQEHTQVQGKTNMNIGLFLELNKPFRKKI